MAIALAAFLITVKDLQAAGDGPRVHGASPIGINGLVLSGSTLRDANRTFDPSLIRPLRFDTDIVSLTYVGTREVRNRHVTFIGTLRGGQAKRQAEQTSGRETRSSSGLADPYIAASINLFGLPPLDRESYTDFKHGLNVNFLIGVLLPVGEYDVSNVVNLGANRWTIQFALPITRPFSGFRDLPGTLELIPNLQVFTENKDRNLEQDPLFTLEGHVTQNFSPRGWGSLGFLYERGGKTEIMGETTNGDQRSLSLTATLGINVSPRWAVQLRFGQVVDQNEFGRVGRIYQFKLGRFF